MNKQNNKWGQRVLLFLALALSALVASCDFFAVMDQDERLQAFVDDLNAGRYSSLYTHFHPDVNVLDELKGVYNWGPLEADNKPFTKTSTFTFTNDGDVTFTVTFEADGGDEFIRTMAGPLDLDPPFLIE